MPPEAEEPRTPQENEATAPPGGIPVTPRPKKKRRRRWIRRLAVVVGALLLLLVLLVIFAPMMVTSGFGERKIASAAEGFLDADVTLEGLSFGWRTPLRIERAEVALPGGKRLASVRGLAVDLTLTQALGFARTMDLEKLDVRIESVSAHVTRDAEGNLDVLGILPPSDSSTPSPDTGDGQAEMPTLPVRAASVKIEKIDLLFTDEGINLTAGWEEGALEIAAPAWNQPITIDVKGQLRANDVRKPWSIRAKIENLVSGRGELSPARAVLTSGSDAMIHERQIADGGYFLRWSMEADAENVLRIEFPVTWGLDLARGALPTADLPAASGTLDLLVRANNRTAGGATGAPSPWAVDASLELKQLRVANQLIDMPPLDGTLKLGTESGTGALVFGDNRVEVDLPFLDVTATAGMIDARDLASVPRVALAVNADLDAMTRFVNRTVALRDEPNATGGISLEVGVEPAGGGAFDYAVGVDFRPGELVTLMPYSTDPALLGGGPVDLAALGTQARLTGRIMPGDRVPRSQEGTTVAATGSEDSSSPEGTAQVPESFLVTASVESFANPVLALAQFDASFDSGTMAWSAETSGGLDLRAIHAAVEPLGLAGPLEELAGRLEFAGVAAEGTAESVTSSGRVDLRDVVARIAGRDEPVAEQETSVAWDLSYATTAGAATVRSLDIRSAALDLALRGNAGTTGRLDIEMDATINLDEATRRAALFGGMPASPSGRVDATASVVGDMAERVRADVRASTDGAVAGHPMATDEPVPAEVAFGVEVEMSGGQPVRATVSGGRVRVGGALDMGVDAGWVADRPAGASGSAQATVSLEQALALVSPGYRARWPVTVDAMGTVSVELDFDVASPERAAATGVLLTEVAFAEWQTETGQGMVEDLADNRAFEVRWDAGGAAPLYYSDRGDFALAYVQATPGIEAGGLALESQVTFTSDGNTTAAVQRLALGQAAWFGEGGMAQVPAVELSGTATWDAGARVAALNGGRGSVDGVGSGQAGGFFDAAAGEWGTEFDIAMDDVGMALGLVDFPALAALPELGAALALTGRFDGAVPPQGIDPLRWIPATGFATLTVDRGYVLDFPRVAADGIAATAVLEMDEARRSVRLDVQGDVSELVTEAAIEKPLSDLRFRGQGAWRDFDRVTLGDGFLAAPTWGTEFTASADFEGMGELAGAWLAGTGLPFDRLLGSAQVGWVQEAAALDGFAGIQDSEGRLDIEARLDASPLRGVALGWDIEARDVSGGWAGMARVRDLGGTWSARKQVARAGGTALRETPRPGRFTMDELRLGPPDSPWLVRNAAATVDFRGARFDGALLVGDILDGVAAGSFSLAKRDGDPVLAGRLEATNLNMALIGDLEGTGDSVRVSSATDVELILGEFAATDVVNALMLEFQTTRVGGAAFRRLLQALDPEGEDPRIQNALLAARFGQPADLRASLINSLLTVRGEVRAPGGVVFGLPVLDREPAGDIVQLYGFDQRAALLGPARRGLLILLAEDFDELDEALYGTQ